MIKHYLTLKMGGLLKYVISIYLITSTINSYSQKAVGKIVDNQKKLNKVKITNLTTNIVSYSNVNGEFKIKAKLNDILRFTFFSYKGINIKIDSLKLKEDFVVTMEEEINYLDEILISNFSFDLKNFNRVFNEQVQSDIINNPYLYEPQSNGRIDFIKASNYLGEKFIDLLNIERNNKKVDKTRTISFEDLDSLFKKSEFFDDKLLITRLNIDLKNKFLFYSFCEKKIDFNLLKKDNTFILLDELIKISIDFKKYIRL